MIAGFSVIGAVAGIAVLASLPFACEDTPRTDQSAGGDYELCLRTDMPFFNGGPARCYDRAALMALAAAPVLDGGGAAASVTLTHPTDATAPDAVVRNCGVYVDLKQDGWFALTSRDQRREAFFIRACGALSLMLEARAPGVVYFADGSPGPEDMAAFLKSAPFGLVSARETPLAEKPGEGAKIALTLESESRASGKIAAGPDDGAGAADEAVEAGPAMWRFRRGDRLVVIQELALADFDRDGVGELLTFVRAGPVDGTAVFYAVGLLEKDSPESGLSFRPSDAAS